MSKRIKQIAASASAAALIGAASLLSAAPASAATRAPASVAPSLHGPSQRQSVATPNFTGVCVTTWQGYLAYSSCAGIGFWNQYIYCAGLSKPVLGPVLLAPFQNDWFGYCPNGGNVIRAGVDFL